MSSKIPVDLREPVRYTSCYRTGLPNEKEVTMAGQENQQYTVLYGRLSQEDERAGESNSIQHQRTLLEKYAKEKDFEKGVVP